MMLHHSSKVSISADSSVVSKDRLFPIDLLKAISILAVVSFHAVLVPRSSYANHLFFVEGLFAPLRFCVPVFLTISFFLTERSLSHARKIATSFKKRLFRILLPTLFWFSVAAIPRLLQSRSWVEVSVNVITGNIFTGAYYLLILLQLLPIFMLSRRWLRRPLVASTIIGLQVAIFITMNYIPFLHKQELIDWLRVIDRPLLLYWFAYLAIGLFLYQYWMEIVALSKKTRLTLKAMLLLVVFAFSLLEYHESFVRLRGEIPPFEYATVSCLVNVPVLFLCVAGIEHRQVSSIVRSSVSILSKYSLGIFCINGLLRQLFLSFSQRLLDHNTIFGLADILAIKVIGFIILLLLSLGLSIVLSRIGLKAVVQ